MHRFAQRNRRFIRVNFMGPKNLVNSKFHWGKSWYKVLGENFKGLDFLCV